jgi:Redoxin
MDAQRLDGVREQLRYDADARPTLMYVFSPTCGWCKRNHANLKKLIEDAAGAYRIVGLSLSPDVADYLKDAQLSFPVVYVRPSAEMVATYGLGTTPQTLVISREGTIIKAWDGAYIGQTKKDVEGFFKITLPGLESTDSDRVTIRTHEKKGP